MILQRAALFGGTFNPVHFGHLRVAEEVREGFGLDTVYFIPAASPPHKGEKGLVPASDRYEMLAAATADNPGFSVSEAEIRRGGRSYTIDTVDQFFSASGRSSQCYLVMGMDAFAEIDTWKSYLALFERIEMIVISRPEPGGQTGWIERISEVIAGRVSPQYAYDRQRRGFFHPDKCAVYPFEVTPLDISATRIRSLVAEGGSIRYLVPDAAADYLYKKGLYL